ncbi:MAG: hypothetical protein Q9190_002393 [Brigantiaea leucoxantha]
MAYSARKWLITLLQFVVLSTTAFYNDTKGHNPPSFPNYPIPYRIPHTDPPIILNVKEEGVLIQRSLVEVAMWNIDRQLNTLIHRRGNIVIPSQGLQIPSEPLLVSVQQLQDHRFEIRLVTLKKALEGLWELMNEWGSRELTVAIHIAEYVSQRADGFMTFSRYHHDTTQAVQEEDEVR